MPRTYKSKNVQTRPDLAGDQNLTEDALAKAKDPIKDDSMEKLLPLFKKSNEMRKKGCNWTSEQLGDELERYFIYCLDNELKPSKATLRLWLGVNPSTLWSWEKETTKYGEISDVIINALSMIEGQYIQRSEKYPTANIFLLKSTHGHVETKKLDITNDKQSNSSDDIKDIIQRLGLDH